MKNPGEQYLYYICALLLSILLTAGLLTLLVKQPDNERKMARPERNTENKMPTDTGNEIKNEAETEKSDIIRVLIKTNGFKKKEHKEISLKAKSGLRLYFGEEVRETNAKETVKITSDNEMFQKGTIIAEPKAKGEKIELVSLKRGYGVPSYRGKIELFREKTGIFVVNELSLEEYLYAVVPSEMPSSYELEALKAQAVCARSYAAKQTENYSYPKYKAHVDDSTSFQVYGNSKEQPKAIRAVDETFKEKVWYNGEVATTYYFSTSCGQTTTAKAWGNQKGKSKDYLKSVKVADEQGAYEKDLPWYRWTAKINEKCLANLICANTKTDIGKLKKVRITKRGPGNIALRVTVTGTKKSVTIDTENKIRKAFGGEGYEIQRQDGKKVKSSALLPSAFFTIEKKGSDYIIKGGGFGHGIGMSQNGANEMAKKGKTYREILEFFYRHAEISRR